MRSLQDRADAASSIRIVHSIPGRLRLRLPAHVDAELVTHSVQDLAGGVSCVSALRTRGLLVLYRPEVSIEAILEAVREGAGDSALVESRTDASDEAGPVLGAAVSGAAIQLDRGVRQVTGNLVGLGGLIPAALVIWAVRELMLGCAAPLAGSSALWSAHGLFRDYNIPSSH